MSTTVIHNYRTIHDVLLDLWTSCRRDFLKPGKYVLLEISRQDFIKPGEYVTRGEFSNLGSGNLYQGSRD